jgi:hypothetical protein
MQGIVRIFELNGESWLSNFTAFRGGKEQVGKPFEYCKVTDMGTFDEIWTMDVFDAKRVLSMNTSEPFGWRENGSKRKPVSIELNVATKINWVIPVQSIGDHILYKIEKEGFAKEPIFAAIHSWRVNESGNVSLHVIEGCNPIMDELRQLPPTLRVWSAEGERLQIPSDVSLANFTYSFDNFVKFVIDYLQIESKLTFTCEYEMIEGKKKKKTILSENFLNHFETVNEKLQLLHFIASPSTSSIDSFFKKSELVHEAAMARELLDVPVGEEREKVLLSTFQYPVQARNAFWIQRNATLSVRLRELSTEMLGYPHFPLIFRELIRSSIPDVPKVASRGGGGGEKGKKAEDAAQVFAENKLSSDETVTRSMTVNFNIASTKCKGEFDAAIQNTTLWTISEIIESKCGTNGLYGDFVKMFLFRDTFLNHSAMERFSIKMRESIHKESFFALSNMSDDFTNLKLAKMFVALGPEASARLARGEEVDGVNMCDNTYSLTRDVTADHVKECLASLPRDAEQQSFHCGKVDRSLRYTSTTKITYVLPQSQKVAANPTSREKSATEIINQHLVRGMNHSVFGQTLHNIAANTVNLMRAESGAISAPFAGILVEIRPAKPAIVTIRFHPEDVFLNEMWDVAKWQCDIFSRAVDIGQLSVYKQNSSGEFDCAEIRFSFPEAEKRFTWSFEWEGFVGNLWRGLQSDEKFLILELQKKKLSVGDKLLVLLVICPAIDEERKFSLCARLVESICPNFMDIHGISWKEYNEHKAALRLRSIASSKKFEEQYAAGHKFMTNLMELCSLYSTFIFPELATLYV